MPLIPLPRSLTPREGNFLWPVEAQILPSGLRGLPIGEQISLGSGVIRVVEAPLAAEAYRLLVRPHEIEILASGPAGVRHAAATLAQLHRDHVIPCLEIEDSPQFAWRGMMLDPSRHFLPIPWIEHFVDLLAEFKFNRLHLHLCDDQGWRIEIRKYPRLTEVGGWRTESQLRPGESAKDGQPHGGFYTQAELRGLVAYAAERGITVMPEIEMPGHCTAALAAYPELGETLTPLQVGTRWGVYEDVYTPTERVIRFLEDVLEEVLEIFPSEFIHVGGDEVPKKQWRASSAAQARITELGLRDEDGLQSWFIRHFDRWLAARGRRLVGWDEILEGGLAPGATVMSWRGFSGGLQAARMGHDVVLAPVSHVYFDHYQTKFRGGEPVAIGGYTPLSKTYAFDPVPPELEADKVHHVLGAQGQLWSEYLRTPADVEYAALPRMLALSEALWGTTTSFEDFLPRAQAWTDRLRSRGWNARPIQPEVPEGYVCVDAWSAGELGPEPTVRRIAVPAGFEAGFDVLVIYTGGASGVKWHHPDGEGFSGNRDILNRRTYPAGTHTVELRLSSETSDCVGEVYLTPT